MALWYPVPAGDNYTIDSSNTPSEPINLNFGSNSSLTIDGVDVSGTDVAGNGPSVLSIENGGKFTVTSWVSSPGTVFQIGDNSSLAFEGEGSHGLDNHTIAFTGAGNGTLKLGDWAHQQYDLNVQGFGHGDVIDFAGSPTVTYSGDSTHTVISLKYDQYEQPITITLEGDYDPAHFSVGPNGEIEYNCFLAGTLISTPTGAVAIETLKAGDLVLTSEGAAKPVRWLARQTVATLFADPLRVSPIRILAGALGENLPERDLFVSADHALLVDGVLVQAGALVNDGTIARVAALPSSFVYYHVELEDHSLILAEGVPAETFLDTTARRVFDNWEEAPAGEPLVEMDFPRAKARRQVPAAIHARLAARAGLLLGSAVAKAA